MLINPKAQDSIPSTGDGEGDPSSLEQQQQKQKLCLVLVLPFSLNGFPQENPDLHCLIQQIDCLYSFIIFEHFLVYKKMPKQHLKNPKMFKEAKIIYKHTTWR